MALAIDAMALPLAGCGETVIVNGEEVGNVLVGPSDRAATDLADPAAPAGARIDYRLDFPKAYTGDLTGAVLTVRGRIARIVGSPVRYAGAPVPGDWNCTAYASAAQGDLTAQVRICVLTSTVDDEGEPVRAEAVVYEGPAQARMTGGSTAPAAGVERASEEEWHFVVPWDDAMEGLRPESTVVSHGGARYDVSYIRDIDGARTWIDVKAMRHG